LVCLFLVFLPGIGIKAGGASRWLNIGFTSVQPAEFLKLSAILYLSAWIASKLSEENVSDLKANFKKNSYNFFYVFVPFIVFLGIIAIALALQRDLSTLGIIAATLLAVYFASRTPLWHTLAIVSMGVITCATLVVTEPYRLQRFFTFLNPGQDPLGQGHQTTQSIISLGSGGFWGKGLGLSAQKMYIPEAMTDSIFAVIGEEVGLIGSVILIGLFIALLWAGIYLYKNSSDKFSRSVAIGIVCWISLQALINIASSAGAFPLAGIPLPFFSYGGSHITVELIGMGLLLNIAKKI
jgi:cell division protein FtsW